MLSISLVVFGLGDSDAYLASSLRSKFPINLFNPGENKTDKTDSTLRRDVMTIYDRKCVVCGVGPTANRVISCAHILNSAKACETLFIKWTERNFLALCGTRNDEGSCHDAFDKGKMSFMHISGESTLWKVIGGGSDRHNRTVDLKSNPYKRTLHTHFARCIVNQSLVLPIEAEDIDPDDVTVSNSMEDKSTTIFNSSVNSVVSAEFITNVERSRID